MKKIIFLILPLLFPVVIQAAIIFDASSTVKTFSGVTTATSTITVGSGSNQLLVITFIYANTASPTGITVDGTSATKAVSASFSGTARDAEIWYAKGLTSGVHNASVTWTGTRAGNLELSSYFGVNQNTPLDVVASTTVQVNLSSVSSSITTTAAGDLIVDNTAKTASDAVNGTVNGNQVLLLSNNGINGVFGDSSYLFATSSQAYKTGYIYASAVTSTIVQAAFKAAAVAPSRRIRGVGISR